MSKETRQLICITTNDEQSCRPELQQKKFMVVDFKTCQNENLVVSLKFLQPKSM
jgi:hypothetical protein